MADPQAEVQNIFDKMSKSGIVGGYIVLAEVLKENEVQLCMYVSRGVTPWGAAAMLSEGLTIVPDSDIDLSFEDDEAWGEYFGEDF